MEHLFNTFIFSLQFTWPIILFTTIVVIIRHIRRKKEEKIEAEIQKEWIDYQAKQTALEIDKLQHPEKYEQ